MRRKRPQRLPQTNWLIGMNILFCESQYNTKFKGFLIYLGKRHFSKLFFLNCLPLCRDFELLAEKTNVPHTNSIH